MNDFTLEILNEDGFESGYLLVYGQNLNFNLGMICLLIFRIKTASKADTYWFMAIIKSKFKNDFTLKILNEDGFKSIYLLVYGQNLNLTLLMIFLLRFRIKTNSKADT